MGCKITGGGWINGKNPLVKNGKANFGFNGNVTVEDSDYDVSGEFQYDDKTAFNRDDVPIRFHGVFDSGLKIFGAYAFSGTYTPQPPILDSAGDPETGRFIVVVADNGKPNEADPEDYILVKCLTGPFKGYSNSGNLQGGNIVNHDN